MYIHFDVVFNVCQVDTHIHATACMSQYSLLKFMRRKAKNSPDDIVAEKDGKKLTILEFFDSLGLSPDDLSVDSLDVHA
ncbi:AMP deaminase 3 isoform X3, partial [Paramuricea clavata]